jgi:predicted signal transduction protein with EAL and GGDEF domain
MGCTLGQGYLYSRPVPPEELLGLLTRAMPLGIHADPPSFAEIIGQVQDREAIM